jgi:spermidine synthase
LSRLLLAFLSGIPALVYQVIWTREVGLLAGTQIGAVSVVLVAFFGGLALGAGVLGAIVDRHGRPLVFYAWLEVGAGALALGAAASFPALAELALGQMSQGGLLVLAAAALLPSSFLLGGTIPALLRSAGPRVARASSTAARLIAANTAGSVLGVGLAVGAAPLLGLQFTLAAAGVLAIAIGALAAALARGAAMAVVETRVLGQSVRVPTRISVAAALSGAAMLGYEVLATRAATLRLGSSLYAWGLVLALFLIALALAYGVFGAWARRTARPERDLGLVAAAAAAALAAGLGLLVPSLDHAAEGLTVNGLIAVVAGVLPAVFLMGGVWPLLLRLGLSDRQQLGGQLGALSAANTLGGAGGALLAPYLLPTLGLVPALLGYASVTAALGIAFLWRAGTGGRSRQVLASLLAAVVLAVPAGFALRHAPGSGHVLHVGHGSQATAVVVRTGAGRTLIVDGDPEAATFGNARTTEELLALLPLALHPRARNFLEIGLGSGITLGTAARFPLERIDCVEIARSVLSAAFLFEPANRGVMRGNDPRVRLIHDDGRAYLARHRDEYDVIVANTLHPWSVGSTGLYSREYFSRIRRALRSGGVAVQWLPVERVGADALAAILRTITAVFPDGSLWWGAESLLVVARDAPAPDLEPRAVVPGGPLSRALAELGIASRDELWSRRLADFDALREALGAGEVLDDDRPRLEVLAARARRDAGDLGESDLVRRIAQTAARHDRALAPTVLWLDARAARAAGNTRSADRLEAIAEAAGVEPARRDRIARAIRGASAHFESGHYEPAARLLEALLEEFPRHRSAHLALARVRSAQREPARARQALEALLEFQPRDAEAWNALGLVHQEQGDSRGAAAAFGRALAADPFLVQALANRGLLAARAGDSQLARAMLRRIWELSPRGPGAEARALAAALPD